MMRTKQTFILCLLLFLLTAGLANGRQATGATSIETATIQQLDMAPDSLQFTLQTPFAQYDDGQLTIAGLERHLQTPGVPALPVYTTFIALPPTGSAVVTVRPTTVTQQRLHGRSLEPAREPHLLYHPLYADEFDLPADSPLSRNPDDLFVMVVEPNEAIYGADAFYPAVYFHLSEPMQRRDVRLAQLTLYPAQYNPARNELIQAERLDVTITFADVTPQINHPAVTADAQHIHSLRDLVLNFDQIAAWRSLPLDLGGEPTLLPIGQETYKITVGQTGVYELTYQMLADAGMDVANVDPLTFEMLHRGQPVAYEFVGNPHDGFQPGEAVRFYGWVGLGSRLEDQYVRDNVFWLWAGGQPTIIGSRPSEAGYLQADYFPESLTFEENNLFTHTWTNLWSSFPNEPDAWYWDRLYNQHPHSPTYTYPITLPYPSLSGPDAQVTVEYLSRAHQVINNVAIPHEMRVYLNDHPDYGALSWLGIGVYSMRSVNITTTAPMTAVLSGPNTVTAVMATDPTPPRSNAVFTNRITVDYARQFVAVNDELAFAPPAGGGWTFAVSDFTVPPAVVWDISDRLQPVAITGATVSGAGPYTLTFGGAQLADSRFIVSGQLLVPLAIDQYIPPDLNPAEGVADWVAITHRDFLTETNRLASHRADPVYGGLAAHVVDIEDVVNQYGYGLAMPRAVNDYLRHAMVHWAQAPDYLLLVGDATDNPRFETVCPPGFIVVSPGDCASPWNPTETQFVAAEFVYEDRWNGRIPSDFTMSLLVGDDLIPDIAVGRLTAQTAAQAAAMVDKIILFEANLLNPSNLWTNEVLFVSDRLDAAGDFCALSTQTAAHLPDVVPVSSLCYTTSHTAAAFRQLVLTQVNDGLSILNYRGHGSVTNWGRPAFLNNSPAQISQWLNEDKPIVILSVDCLDGYYSWPGNPGLGETYHKLADTGTAAHWSATGLGTTFEHSILNNNFYRAVYDQGLTAIGDAIGYAKLQYFLSGSHRSQLYSFNLHGDPAMQLVAADLHLEQELLATDPILPGDQFQMALTVTNEALHPAVTTIVSQLSDAATFVAAETNIAGVTATEVDGTLSLALSYLSAAPNRGLPPGETAVIILTLQISPIFDDAVFDLHSVAQASGLIITPGANEAVTSVPLAWPTTELLAFNSQTVDEGIRLSWETATEFSVQGFQMWRSPTAGGPFVYLSDIGLTPGTGGPAFGASYVVTDTTRVPGQAYWYQLVEVKLDGELRPLTPTLPYLATSELSLFTAAAAEDGVNLTWVTANEIGSEGFWVRRSEEQHGPYEILPGIGFAPALGAGTTYTATDVSAIDGQTYWYELLELKLDGDQRPVILRAPTFFPTVELESFTTRTRPNGVEIAWTTGLEFGSESFELWRGDSFDGPFPVFVAELPSAGSGTAGADYAVVDESIMPGMGYYYRLIEIKQGNDERPLLPILHYPASSELASFTLATVDDGIQFTWVMSVEIALDGFFVARSLTETGPYEAVTALVPAVASGFTYTTTDSTAVPGQQYWYQLWEVKLDGDERPFSPPLLYLASAELLYFTAIADEDHTTLEWRTATEPESVGFRVRRSLQPEGPYEWLMEAGVVPALGAGSAYTITDSSAAGQLYWYELVEVKSDGDLRPLTPRALTQIPMSELYLPIIMRP